MLYVWCAVMAVSLIVEILTRRLISIWFLPAGLVGLVLSVCEVAPILQILACLAFANIGLLIARMLFGKKQADALACAIGKTCTVTERLDSTAGCGQVQLDGQYWAARAIRATDVYERGETVCVVAIEGVKLICKKP